MYNANALINRKYGRLLIVEIHKSENGQVALCICDCNSEHKGNLSNIVRGKTQSCGCLRRELAQKRGQYLRNQAMRKVREHINFRLTVAEREQVDRIVASRNYRKDAIARDVTRHEAIEVVVADRRVGELLCHGGEIEIL